MGTEGEHFPACLTMGVLWNAEKPLQDARAGCEDLFGRILMATDPVPFDRYTRYYEKEMGKGIQRAFWIFDEPFRPGALVEAKLSTNGLEREMSVGGKRVVNLDPGLLTHESLVLATTKPYSHRIYLSKGIYADLTLIYRKGRYEPLQWSYPDYREATVCEFLGKVRDKCLRKPSAGGGVT